MERFLQSVESNYQEQPSEGAHESEEPNVGNSRAVESNDRESPDRGRGASTNDSDEPPTEVVPNVVEEEMVGHWNKIHVRNHLLDFIREGS